MINVDPRRLRDVRPSASTHAGLWLERYLSYPTWRGEGAPAGYDKDRGRSAKQELVDELESKCGRDIGDYPIAFQHRRDGFGSDRCAVGDAKASGRVLIGIGAKGPAEFGITLDHTWGVPILPGSSLKGIAALGADRYLADPAWRRRADSATARTGGATAFDALFGDPDEQGAVIFHDAWWVPNAEGSLAADVLTVHHPDYYQRDAEPSDTDDPVPVPFVTARGSFLVALELVEGLDETKHGHWLRAAWEALRLGLKSHGVGAKTNAGYGRIELPDWSKTPMGAREEQRRLALERAAEESRLVEEARRRAEALVQLAADRAAMSPADRIAHVRVDGDGPLFAWLSEDNAPLGCVDSDLPLVIEALGAKAKQTQLHPRVSAVLQDLERSSRVARAWTFETALADVEPLLKKGAFDKAAKKVAGFTMNAEHLEQLLHELARRGAKAGHLRPLNEKLAALRSAE